MLHLQPISIERIDQVEYRRALLVHDAHKDRVDAFFLRFFIDLCRSERCLIAIVLFPVEFSIGNQGSLAWLVAVLDRVALTK